MWTADDAGARPLTALEKFYTQVNPIMLKCLFVISPVPRADDYIWIKKNLTWSSWHQGVDCKGDTDMGIFHFRDPAGVQLSYYREDVRVAVWECGQARYQRLDAEEATWYCAGKSPREGESGYVSYPEWRVVPAEKDVDDSTSTPTTPTNTSSSAAQALITRVVSQSLQKDDTIYRYQVLPRHSVDVSSEQYANIQSEPTLTVLASKTTRVSEEVAAVWTKELRRRRRFLVEEDASASGTAAGGASASSTGRQNENHTTSAEATPPGNAIDEEHDEPSNNLTTMEEHVDDPPPNNTASEEQEDKPKPPAYNLMFGRHPVSDKTLKKMGLRKEAVEEPQTFLCIFVPVSFRRADYIATARAAHETWARNSTDVEVFFLQPPGEVGCFFLPVIENYTTPRTATCRGRGATNEDLLLYDLLL